MSLQRFTTPPRPSTGTVTDEDDQLANALYRALLVAPPKRAALMTAKGDRKYSDAPKHHLFSLADMRDHLAGRRTWAVTLGDASGQARAGCRDYDAGGEAVIRAALARAKELGQTAFGILMQGEDDEHSGGHIWELYKQSAPIADITAQLAQLPDGKGEIYPSGNCIRFPFGLHRRKNTRGILILQDGRCFDLDTPEGLRTGMQIVATMQRNSAPPPAPEAAKRSSTGNAFVPVNLADYANLIDGALLRNAPRYVTQFRVRPQLAKLAAGERVTLMRDGVADDSDSAQVACLISNLLTTCKKGGRPGEGAPPLAEIRSIALYMKPALRDGRSLAHYRAQIEYEISKYLPEHYTPEATSYIPGIQAPAPTPLGRPVGDRADGMLHLIELVSTLPADAEDWHHTTRAHLANTLGCGVDMVTCYLRDGRMQELIDSRQTQRGLRIVIKSAGLAAIQARNRSTQDRITTPKNANDSCIGDTLPRPPASCAESDPATATTQSAEAPTTSTTTQAEPQHAPGECVSSLAARLTLAELVHEAFEAGANRLCHIRRYCEMNAFEGMQYSDSALVYRVGVERRIRQQVKLEQQVRNLPLKVIKRKARSLAGRSNDLQRQGKDKQAYVFRLQAGVYEAEIMRRADLVTEDALIDLEIARVAGQLDKPVKAPKEAYMRLASVDSSASVQFYDDAELIRPNGTSSEPPMQPWQPSRPATPLVPAQPLDGTFNPTAYHGPTDEDIAAAIRRGKSSLQLLLEQRETKTA